MAFGVIGGPGAVAWTVAAFCVANLGRGRAGGTGEDREMACKCLLLSSCQWTMRWIRNMAADT